MRMFWVGVWGMCACLFIAGAALADPIDLWEQFPDTQGDNDFFALALPWNNTGEGSYRWMDDLGYKQFGTLNETDMNIPFIKQSESEWIFMHPAAAESSGNGTGLIYESAIYTYKVPVAGVYDISGTFEKAGANDTYVFVKHNREFIWNNTFLAATPTGTQASFNLLGQTLAQGDEIYYGVGCGLSQKDFGDLTYLKGQINLVPEPVSSALFLLGGGVILGVGRIRRKKAG
ncbi:MAG: PEP-CTERM sorting domain-containing protein [Candidatus Omnitrophica bacterium]|nr:PEP-CTERM sorting domain-containing protein [Candidatus Omnitrophota bacterium]